jgi:F0F1-type ATP synthase membrane subunit b/b'
VIVLVYTWIASIVGAALFFAAGAMWTKRRVAPGERAVRYAEAERDRLAESLMEAGAQAERAQTEARAGADRMSAHARGEVERIAAQARAEAEQLAAQTRAEAERVAAHGRAETERLGGQLRSAMAQLDRSAAELRFALAEKDRLAGELTAAHATLEPLARKARLEEDRAAVRERALAAVQAERQKLAEEIAEWQTRMEAADGDLRAVSAARDRMAAELDDARARLQAAEGELERAERRPVVPPADAADSAVAGLRHELLISVEREHAREAQLDRLREEAARLRMVETDLEQARRESGRLVEEVRTLRATAFAGRPPRRIPRATPAPIPDSASRSDVFQSILENETRNDHVHSAVIADELGLVVASTGEYGDALAAFGAYLAEVGAKTREVLPLNALRQVTVRDDHNVTLTVRPLENAESNLALVMLTIGNDEMDEKEEVTHGA